jgi:hypothetical protein
VSGGTFVAQPYDAADPDVKTSAMQAAATWAAIYATTTDPGIEGVPWNNNGHFVFSTGYFPSLDFSNSKNSMYAGAIF